MLESFFQLDGNILLFIQEYIRNPILTPIFKFITHLGDKGTIWILLSLILLIPKKTRRVGVISFVALAGTLIINNGILKNLVQRTRPYEIVQGLEILIKKPWDFSFPSGHTGSAFASGCVLYRYLPKRYGIPAMILAVLIAFSRLYIGVHYPTDVLFGAISGIAISLMAAYIVDKCETWANRKM